MGDGGGAGDPNGNGQNTDALLGKILRIDPTAPTGDQPYAIPAGNPFADGSGGAPEVWLYGVRNPWRFSFDTRHRRPVGRRRRPERGRGDRLAAGRRRRDAGPGRQPRLEPEMEGDPAVPGRRPPRRAPSARCSSTPTTAGTARSPAATSTGARTSPPCRAPTSSATTASATSGACSQRNGRRARRALARRHRCPANSLTSFGQDNDGELYVLSADGTVYQDRAGLECRRTSGPADRQTGARRSPPRRPRDRGSRSADAERRGRARDRPRWRGEAAAAATGHELYWWKELGIVLVFDLIYETVRNLSKSGAGRAFDNAMQVIDWQKDLGIYHEHGHPAVGPRTPSGSSSAPTTSTARCTSPPRSSPCVFLYRRVPRRLPAVAQHAAGRHAARA